MNHSDDAFAKTIVHHLDFGADHLDRSTQERLHDARKAALSHYREKPEPAWGLAWTGREMSRRSDSHAFSPRYVIAGAALIVALIGIAYWQKAPVPGGELADIDVALLTDDLPINAYLDKGFDSWLKRSSR